MPHCLQAIFTSYGFHFPLTVALLQMLFISPVSYLVARPALSLENLKGLAPLAIVNVMNVVCGLIGALWALWREQEAGWEVKSCDGVAGLPARATFAGAGWVEIIAG